MSVLRAHLNQAPTRSDYLMENDGWMEMPAEFLGWAVDDKAGDIRSGLELCHAVVASHENRTRAEQILDCFTRRAEPAAVAVA